MPRPEGVGENGWRLSRAQVVGDGRGSWEPQREESVSCALLGSCDLSFGPFHVKSLMCGLIDTRTNMSCQVTSSWLMVTVSGSKTVIDCKGWSHTW